jgi:hypothetical protein
MSSVTPDRNAKTASEVRNVKVDFYGKLDSGELLSGTPTVEEVSTSDLTFASVAKNSTTITINDRSVSANQAVQFKVSGGVSGRTYTIRVTCATDSTPAQTLIAYVKLRVTEG